MGPSTTLVAESSSLIVSSPASIVPGAPADATPETLHPFILVYVTRMYSIIPKRTLKSENNLNRYRAMVGDSISKRVEHAPVDRT
jgi:hypothetical protein